MKSNKDRVVIDLSLIEKHLQEADPLTIRPIFFQVEVVVFSILHVFIINIVLYDFAVYNYNWTLIMFNLCYLSRRLLKTLQVVVTLRDPLQASCEYLALSILMISLIFTIGYCLIMLFVQHSLTIMILLIVIFVNYYFYSSVRKERYFNGYYEARQCMKHLILHVVELTYCASVLPYQLMPRSGHYFDGWCYLMLVFSLGCSENALLFSEILRRKSVELHSYLRSLGGWEPVHSNHYPIEDWKLDRNYTKGELVRYNGQIWKAIERNTICEPIRHETYLLYAIFNNPGETLLFLKWGVAVSIMLHAYFLLYHAYSSIFSLAFTLLIYVAMRLFYITHQVQVR